MGGEVNDTFELLTFYIDSHCIFSGENQGGFSPLLAEWRCDRPHGLRSSWLPGLDFHCPYGGIGLGPPTMQANTAARVHDLLKSHGPYYFF